MNFGTQPIESFFLFRRKIWHTFSGGGGLKSPSLGRSPEMFAGGAEGGGLFWNAKSICKDSFSKFEHFLKFIFKLLKFRSVFFLQTHIYIFFRGGDGLHAKSIEKIHELTLSFLK